MKTYFHQFWYFEKPKTVLVFLKVFSEHMEADTERRTPKPKNFSLESPTEIVN